MNESVELVHAMLTFHKTKNFSDDLIDATLTRRKI